MTAAVSASAAARCSAAKASRVAVSAPGTQTSGEHARAGAPVRAHGRQDRLAQRRGRGVGAVGEPADHRERLDLTACGVRGRHAGAPGDPEQRHRPAVADHGLQRAQLGLDVGPLGADAVGQPGAQPVVADHRAIRGQRRDERAVLREGPLELEVAAPVRGQHERRPFADGGERDPAPVDLAEPDLLVHRQPSATAVPVTSISGRSACRSTSSRPGRPMSSPWRIVTVAGGSTCPSSRR